MKCNFTIPNLLWWQNNGMPVKEIPISKKSIRNLSNSDKIIVAIATFPLLKRALIKAALAFIILIAGILAGVIMSNVTGGDAGTLLIAVAVGAILSFIISIKTAALIDGFDRIKGSQILGLSIGFRLFKTIISFPTLIFGFFAQTFLQMINMVDKSKMLGMPRLGMPQNAGFDNFIIYYSAYEKEVNDKAPAQALAYNYKPMVEEWERLCKQKTKEVNESNILDFSEKQKALAKIDKVKKAVEDLGKSVDKSIKPVDVK